MRSDCDVLVVGAGPVGLAVAIELGMQDVRVRVVERNIRGGVAPRAKTSNVRTRTLLRRWGIADRLAEESPMGVTYPNDVMFVTRLSGHLLAHFKNAFNAAPVRSPLYPEHAQWVPQYTLEAVLLEHARTLPSVEVSFDVAFVSADQHGEGVVSILQDGAGKQSKIRSQYVVGADGARSTVREVIGAKMEGRYGLSRNSNIIFRAPGLAQANPKGEAIMYWQMSADGASIVGPMDRGDVWFFGAGVREGEPPLSHDEIKARIAKTTGIDLPYEILSADEWVASQLLADRYRSGRIFLAGDACHIHPPFGGYGMNMGISDGVDLGWKLTAVLKGWGSPALLDSYETERRPVHQAVIDEAVANHAVLGGQLYIDGLEDDTPEGEALRKAVGERILAAKAREFHTLGTVLGLGYEKSPLNTPDGSRRPGSKGQVYRPSARPGQIAPHAWLPDGRSLYDLFGFGFALIVADSASEAQVCRAEQGARELGVPLQIVRPQGVPVKALYKADLTLVRPDQYVAWRGAEWSEEALRRAIGARAPALVG